MFAADTGAIVDERDCILLFFAHEREKFTHDRIGQEHPIIGRVIVPLTHALDHADHFEAQAVEQDCVSHRRPAREQVFQHLVANHGDETFLPLVAIVEPAPGGQRQISDGIVMRRYAADFAVGVAVLTDLANIQPREHGGRGANVRCAKNVRIVAVCEAIVPPRTHIAGNGRSASGKHEHDVFAERIQCAAVAGTESLA